ncbi:MAG TPA: GlsB/YeaQ/YmgE family stress response membrane protein [Caulobacteraceae bacterium]|jgi:uncharacterized membrane protein YeaQ/YmgE (transglycosylase-associated protein family)|nr:GlsB/YeaQ/YmgE family stress response membrane protein [Caulobacteraceae bacterium]
MVHWLIVIVIGGIAGWLAGLVVRGRGFGIIGDIVVGVIGSFIGAWLFANVLHIHISGGWGAFGAAFVGAALLVLILRLIRR